MFRSAKYMKDRCALIRRTTTSLEQLSHDAGLDLADRGLLLKATQVLASMSSRAATEAKQLKAKEAAFAKTQATAHQAAAALIAQWPVNTTADQVALIATNGQLNNLTRNLAEDNTSKCARWALNYFTDDARRGLLSALAYAAATGKGSVGELTRQRREQFDDYRSSAAVVRIASQIDTLLQQSATEATPS